MKKLALLTALLTVFCTAALAKDETKKIPAHSKVYIAPIEGGFENDLKTAFEKKNVPLDIVTDRGSADFELTGTAESQKAGKAKKIISYVWDTSAPVGTQESETYAMGLYKVKVLCVQSGSEGLGEWHKLHRDLRADYKALFGSDDFPGVAGIRIQSNSQYTHTSASGAVRSLVLRQASAAPAPGN